MSSTTLASIFPAWPVLQGMAGVYFFGSRVLTGPRFLVRRTKHSGSRHPVFRTYPPHRRTTMSNETKTDRTLTGDEARSVAADFENREFTPDELAKIKRARRRSPRIGEVRGE